MATLFAWATPLQGIESPVDHTWVTDYDNRAPGAPTDIAAVVKAAGNYWYCWGEFHAHSDSTEFHGYLGSEPASAAVTRCICTSNAQTAPDQPTSGTVRAYGIDGVCHQLANQLLWATGSHSQPPLTVASARGYGASIFFYGTYGLQHDAWAARHAACSKMPPQRMHDDGVVRSGSPSGTDDAFAEKATAVLSRRVADNKLPALLVLRRQAQEKLLAAAAQKRVTARALNEIHRFFLGRATTLLDEATFAEIFDLRVADIARLDLVDPHVFAEAQSRRDGDPRPTQPEDPATRSPPRS